MRSASGVVEARAMLSFLPALAPAVLGQDLAIPNLRDVVARRSRPAQRSPGGTGLAGDRARPLPATSPIFAWRCAARSELVPGSRDRLVEAIGRRGADFVAQEAVTLVDHAGLARRQARAAAVHPAAVAGARRRRLAGDAGRLRPRRRRRRCARRQPAAGRAHRRRLGAVGQAGRTSSTLLPTPDRIEINRATGALPSRAAANLFWLGRYVERTEATLRLVRALLNRATESDEAALDVDRAHLLAARRPGMRCRTTS